MTTCEDPSNMLGDFCTWHSVLKQDKYNWFEVVEYAESTSGKEYDYQPLKQNLLEFYKHLDSLPLDPSEKTLLKQSYAAFSVTHQPDAEDARCAAVIEWEHRY